MTNIYKAKEAIRDYLREQLPDPISRGNQWIHCGDLTDIGKVPCIRIESSAYFPFYPIGTNHPNDMWVVRIHVIVGRKEPNGVVNDVRITNAEELAETLLERMEDILLTGDTKVSTDYIQKIWKISSRLGADTEQYLIRTNEYRVQLL